MNDARRILDTTKHKGTERFVLVVLAMLQEDGETEPTAERVAELAGMCAKQILRIVPKLKASGSVVTTGGEGRARLRISLASYNEDNLSSQACEDRQSPHVETPAGSEDSLSAQSVPTPEICEDKSYPLSDVRTDCPDYDCRSEDRLSGTPVAPLLPKTIPEKSKTQPTVEAGARAPRHRAKGAKVISHAASLPEDERAVIEAWRRLTKYYPAESVWPFILERLKPDFDAARLMRCGGAYLAHHGRGQSHVAGICDWYRRNQTEKYEASNERTATKPSTRVEKIREYDYSVFDAGEGPGDGDSEVQDFPELESAAAGRSDGDGRRVAGAARR